jgi:ABC-2 type transport system permease protein
MLRKEFTQLFRDPKMRGIVFVAPILMLVIFGYAVNTDVREARIAVMDEDGTRTSRDFIRAITSSGHFVLFAGTRSSLDADRYLGSGECEAFIRIGSGFSALLDSGRPAAVQVLLDGTDPNRSMIMMSYLSRISMSFSESYAQSALAKAKVIRPEIALTSLPSADLKQRILFNPNFESRVYFLPAIIGLLIGLTTVMLTSMSIVRERESGTMEQIIVSPIRPGEFILGKTMPFAAVAFFDILVLTALMIGWFAVPFRGSLLFLLCAGTLYIAACLGIGIYISTISLTQQQAMLSTFLFLLPAILLSGFVFPIESMPRPVQWITYLNPMRYYMEIIRNIFLKGLGPIDLASPILALCGLAAALLSLSVRRYARGND